jgi:hypothetical protein
MNVVFLLYPFFWLGIVMVVGYGFSLLYHWIRYGYMYPPVWIALPIYCVGTFVLIGAMLAGMAAVAGG